MSRFLPYEKYTLTTHLQAFELYNRLSKQVEPFRIFRWSRSGSRPYEGRVNPVSFSIQRIPGYQNSFLPQIKGEIYPESNITRIEMTMRIHPAVLVFIAVWFGGVGSVCIGILVTGILHFRDILHHGFNPIVLVAFAMFGFGYGLIMFGFGIEKRKSKKFLAALFEADGQQT